MRSVEPKSQLNSPIPVKPTFQEQDSRSISSFCPEEFSTRNASNKWPQTELRTRENWKRYEAKLKVTDKQCEEVKTQYLDEEGKSNQLAGTQSSISSSANQAKA